MVSPSQLLQRTSRGGRGGGARPQNTAACILHVLYDDVEQKWITKKDDIKMFKARCINGRGGVGKNAGPSSYTLIEIHLWALLLLVGQATIIGMFMILQQSLNKHVAVLLVYIFALLTLILSNGVLLETHCNE